MIKMLDDRLLIKIIEKEETTASGLILSGVQSTDTFFDADVIAVGEKAEFVEVGDKIVVPAVVKNSKYKIDGVAYSVVSESNVVGIIEK